MSTAKSLLDELLDKDDAAAVERRKSPNWTKPMLATLTHEHFSDPDWLFERKLDGERALVFKAGDSVRLLTRNRKNINDNYPEIAEAVEEQPYDFIADGEIVAFSGNVTSFSRLQQRMQVSDPEKAKATGVTVYMYLFDILQLGDYCVEQVPLAKRKSILKRAIDFGGPLRYTQHRKRNGEAYLREACDKGWEGIIAKEADSAYVHSRSRKWLKFKCANSQELVIGGFTAPEGSRKGFGALLVGYYDGDDLCYAGKVGTGYDDEFLESFHDRLEKAARKTSPFSNGPEDDDSITWVTPRFVGEFAFTEWTNDGKLRHPRFIGLRRDKAPEDVVREQG